MSLRYGELWHPTVLMKKPPVSIFWFRRDLRLHDNHGLFRALQSDTPVQPIFIFDSEILDKLEDKHDKRVEFIHRELGELQAKLARYGASLDVRIGKPKDVFHSLLQDYEVKQVFANHDYEPYARERDAEIADFLEQHQVEFVTTKDQVIFEKSEVTKPDGKPYNVFTPYSRRWRGRLEEVGLEHYPSELQLKNLYQQQARPLPSLAEIRFAPTDAEFPSKKIPLEIIKNYHETRNFPAIDGTSRLSVHLRFGTVSVRELVEIALMTNDAWLNELIWREFLMMILWHYPYVVDQPFRAKYKHIPWRNDKDEFAAWCKGKTGFPLVDAGMRELNGTGLMHNRVRMVVANFLTKILLIDWHWGEHYFAQKLLDYELSSNNGNWQWSAGTGVDAAPYFRIFNPATQMERFDPQMKYVKKWLPEYDSKNYPAPIVDYKERREAALAAYKHGLQSR